MFNIGFYRQNMKKIFLSQTMRTKVLIFGMYNHLVDFYQVCSNCPPGAKNCPVPGGHIFYIGLYREKHGKIVLSETIMPRALIFGMQHEIVDLYQVCTNYAPGVKIGPTPGVTGNMASFQQIPICKL